MIIHFDMSPNMLKIPESKTADKPMALRGRVTQQSRDTKKTN